MIVFLACFDISDDRVRNRVGKALKGYGERVQKSVFEISVRSQEELDKLRNELRDLLEPTDDVRFYALCRACRKRSHDVDEKRIARFPAAVLV